MISIVSITFNNFEELQATVDSLEMVRSPFELVVVNGGSCPRTREYLLAQNIRHISEPDHGISDAFNKGIQLSSGKGILFLNSGDRLSRPDFIEEADRLLDQYDFCYGPILFEDTDAGIIRFDPHGLPLGRGTPYPHQSLVVRKTIFDKIGGFSLDYKNAMCFEFMCRLEKFGAKGVCVDEPMILMDGSGVSTKNESRTIRESLKALKQNDLWNFKNQFFFTYRLMLFSIRRVLILLGLKNVLGKVKSKLRSA